MTEPTEAEENYYKICCVGGGTDGYDTVFVHDESTNNHEVQFEVFFKAFAYLHLLIWCQKNPKTPFPIKLVTEFRVLVVISDGSNGFEFAIACKSF